jgi:hypothetical protein
MKHGGYPSTVCSVHLLSSLVAAMNLCYRQCVLVGVMSWHWQSHLCSCVFIFHQQQAIPAG